MSKVKTEHAGAKNGGGEYGRRAFMKETTKRLRRNQGKDLIHRAMRGEPEDEHDPDWDWTEGWREGRQR